TTSQVIRFAHPSRAALKRVLLKQSSQVAEPNSKPRFIPGLFIACRTLTRDYVPGYSLRSPLRGRAKARSAKAVESRSRSQIQSLGSYRGFSLPAGLSPGLRPRLFASLTLQGRAKARVLLKQS